MYDATAWLDQFLAQSDPGSYKVPFVHHQSARGSRHVVFGFAVHGDEVGSLPAAVRLLTELRAQTIEVAGPITLVIGNPEAVAAGTRAIDSDLNRAWAFLDAARGSEARRASELRPVFDAADLFVDFHQTAKPTRSAFWTLPWVPDCVHWARAIQAAPIGLTRAANQAFASADKVCIDEYVRGRKRTGITIEVGAKGFDPTQSDRVYRAMRRVLALELQLAAGASIATLAERCDPIRWHTTIHREPLAEGRLRDGIDNWQPVRAGEILSAEDSPRIECLADGVILFPKYPVVGQSFPTHLFHLAQPVVDPEKNIGS